MKCWPRVGRRENNIPHIHTHTHTLGDFVYTRSPLVSNRSTITNPPVLFDEGEGRSNKEPAAIARASGESWSRSGDTFTFRALNPKGQRMRHRGSKRSAFGSNGEHEPFLGYWTLLSLSIVETVRAVTTFDRRDRYFPIELKVSHQATDSPLVALVHKFAPAVYAGPRGCTYQYPRASVTIHCACHRAIKRARGVDQAPRLFISAI